jgi:hypothetical protein
MLLPGILVGEAVHFISIVDVKETFCARFEADSAACDVNMVSVL